MDEVEYMFRRRDLETEIFIADAQIAKLMLERDKFDYELEQLNEFYSKEPEPVKEEVEDKVEEIKPKKLRKPNDKPSENHIEV